MIDTNTFRYLWDEHGAEAVEWILVLAMLAIVAHLVLGPGGVVQSALSGGINHISTASSEPPSGGGPSSPPLTGGNPHGNNGHHHQHPPLPPHPPHP